MINDSDSKSVASRIRGLIGGQNHGLVEATARRLRVSEVALRISIDSIEPHPTIEVIMAVVREYGVDPSWLLTGNYDPASHRLALNEEATFTRSDLARLLDRPHEPQPRDPQPRDAQPRDSQSPVDSSGPDLRLEA